MAQFSVNSSSMSDANSEISNAQKSVASLEQDIQNILSKLNNFSGTFSSIRRSLNSQLKGVTDEKEKLGILSQKLGEIISAYNNAENNILNNQSSGAESVEEAIAQASQTVSQLAEQLGVNHACAFGGDPVNLSNGNFIYDKTCMELNSDTELKFRIFYNAQLNDDNAMGRGWTHTFSVRLAINGNNVNVFQGDDSALKFEKNNHSYKALPGNTAELREEDNGFVLTTKDQKCYTFDESGSLTGMCTMSGDWYTVSYREDGSVAEVKDGAGQIHFAYEETGKICEIEDGLGRRVSFAYQDGLLTAVNGLNNRNTYFTYNADGLLQEVLDREHVLLLANTYDSDRRVTSQRFADGGIISYEYDRSDNGSSVVMTQQNGNRVVYQHDSQDRNIGIVYENGEETFEFNDQNLRTYYKDRNGNVNRYEHDAHGNMTRFINACGHVMDITYTAKNQVESVSVDQQMIHRAHYDENDLQVSLENAIGAKEYFEYNERHLPVKWIKADGSPVEMEYDERGNLTAISNSMGGTTRYEYDQWNRTVKSVDAYGNATVYEYDEADEIVAVTDPLGHTRKFEYDNAGNMISVTEPDGAKTHIKYNKSKKPTEMIDALGNVTTREYNVMSDVVKEVRPDGTEVHYEYDQFRNLVKVIDGNGNENSMEYDACGNIVARTDANGNVHRLEYDPMNRPVTVITPAGMKVTGEYDALGNVTAVRYPDGTSEEGTYDLTGNLLSYKDQNGYVKKMTYNVSGDLKQVSDDEGVITTREYYPGGLLKKESNVDGTGTEFYYDKNENVIKAVHTDGRAWEFRYDAAERIVEVLQNGVSSEKYEYDANGNMTAVLDAENYRTEYGYDAVGNLTQVKDALGHITAYRYDACRRLTDILRSPDGHMDPAEIMRFNDHQREWKITSYRYDAAGNLISMINPNGSQIEYQYDGCGNVILKKDEDGNVVTCEYEPDGKERLIRFADGRTIQYEYDDLRRLRRMQDWLGISNIESDGVGRALSVTDPQDDKVQYEWLADGRRASVTYPNGEKLSYGYDEGRRLSVLSNGKHSVSYQYFDFGKLKEKVMPNQASVDYQYGGSGNLASLTNRYNQEIVAKFLYTYDASGRKSTRQVQTPTGEKNYQYEYNPIGNLKVVSVDGEVKEEYRYDCFGNRIWSKVDGVETTYTYDEDDQLLRSQSGTETREYSYDLRGNIRTERMNGSDLYQYEFGALNLLESISSDTEKLIYQYDGFGNRVSSSFCDAEKVESHTNYLYDVTRNSDHLLNYRSGDCADNNVWWDNANSVISSPEDIRVLLHDELMSPCAVVGAGGIQAAISYGTFGESTCAGAEIIPFTYTGYQRNPMVPDRLFANRREYDTRTGRFISKDPVAGQIHAPVTFNPFIYCICDPVNYHDPTGMVLAWLAGGIVGTVSKLATKLAGDVVNSVANGKPTFSSWQSYVGTAVGGFAEGSVLVATGSKTLAGAAGGSAETLVTNGLNMATGVDGYTAEDGYSWKNLLADTAIAGGKGAIEGFAYGTASKYIKIPGITKGVGNYSATWKQLMTKAQKGIIENISWKSIGKGIVAYGGVKFLDKLISKGIDKAKDYLMDKSADYVKSLFDGDDSSDTSTTTAAMANNLMPECDAVA